MKTHSILALTIAALSLFATPALHSQTTVLRELAKEDQDAQANKQTPHTQEERAKLVLEMIGEGALKGPEDKYDAALILQHTGLDFCDKRLISKSPDNYLLAHHLLKSAYAGGYKDARYLIAASLDRYLSFTKGYQKYGTNRVFDQQTGKEELIPIDRKTSDEERAKYGVPPLADLLKQYPEQSSKK